MNNITAERKAESRFDNWLTYVLIGSIPFFGFAVVNVSNRGIRPDWIIASVIISVVLFRVLNDRVAETVTPVGRAALLFAVSMGLSGIVVLLDGSQTSPLNFFTASAGPFVGVGLVLAFPLLKIHGRSISI